MTPTESWSGRPGSARTSSGSSLAESALSIHPALRAAAQGLLPGWAQATRERRAHLTRVADLMESWAVAFERNPDDRGRWRAAGMLHDALRDASPAVLRSVAGSTLDGWPDPLLHGPAAARRLREDGVGDEPLLRAIEWHTVGHPDLDWLGRALYLADHLEPGRPSDPELNAHRRERVRHEMDDVLREVAADRIARIVRQGYPLLEPTVRFWNGIAHV